MTWTVTLQHKGIVKRVLVDAPTRQEAIKWAREENPGSTAIDCRKAVKK